MTITEVNQALGSWELRLRPETPRQVLDALTYFGHVAVFPSRVDPAQYGDNLLSSARYVGVYRERGARDDFILRGAGMAFWLGDEDEKGDVFETAVSLSGATFAASIAALLPPGGSVISGTINSIAGTYSGSHQYETPRKALSYVAGLFGAEWRVNGDATLDAGTPEQLYGVEPRAILLRRGAGRELDRVGLPGTMELVRSGADYTTRVLLLAETQGESVSTGSAEQLVVPYNDLHGNPIRLTRLVNEDATAAGNADARAQLVLNLFSSDRKTVSLDSSAYDVKGDLVVGELIDIWDPSSGFFDPAREVYWQGQPINPITLRCIELSWPVREGWTVAFRDINGNWVDLSPYYAPETGDTTIVVGAFASSLIEVGGTSVIGRQGQPDTSIPAAPTFTGFSTGSYQSGSQNTTRSAIRAQWNTPLNQDASTIIDGSHYEIRYRVNEVIGYAVSWDLLSGYTTLLTEDFDRVVAPGAWGGAWTVSGGVGTDFYVDGDYAYHVLSSTGSERISTLSAISTDRVDLVVGPLTSNQQMAGSDADMSFRVRYVDTNNFLDLRVFRTSTGIWMRLREVLAGVTTQTAFLMSVDDVDGTTSVWARLQADGTTLRGRVWADGADEPGDWSQSMTVSLVSVGSVQVRSWAYPGVTNVGLEFGFGSMLITDLNNSASGYTWDELTSWDTPISDPVEASPEWQTAIIGWGTNAFTLTELTPGVKYELQIRAVDSASPPHSSPWSDSSVVFTVGDLIAPSTPAAPIVAGSLIAIQLEHHLGRASGGTFNLELDLDHLDVHVGGSEGFFADESNKVGELIANSSMMLASNPIPAVGTFQVENTESIWVKVVAVDQAGNKSGGSPGTQVTAELIDNAHISSLSVSKLTAGTITAQSILAADLEVGTNGHIKVSGEGSLQVFNNLGQMVVEVGANSIETDNYGLFVYDPDNQNHPVMEVGEHRDGMGLVVNDPDYVLQLEMGRMKDGDYGFAMVDPAGEMVKMSQIAFGPTTDSVTGFQSTSSSTYTDLATVGPTASGVAIGDSGKCLVIVGCNVEVSAVEGFAIRTAAGFMSFEASGPTSITPSDQRSCGGLFRYDYYGTAATQTGYDLTFASSRVVLVTGLTPGSYTFTAKYRADAGGVSVGFLNRQIAVLPY